MKKITDNLIFRAILTFIFIFFAIYLLGSFYEITFDISEWSAGTRGFVASFGGFLSLVFAGLSPIFD